MMMIKLNGLPLKEHDFDHSAKIFFSKKQRRVNVGSQFTALNKSAYIWGEAMCGASDGDAMAQPLSDVQV